MAAFSVVILNTGKVSVVPDGNPSGKIVGDEKVIALLDDDDTRLLEDDVAVLKDEVLLPPPPPPPQAANSDTTNICTARINLLTLKLW